MALVLTVMLGACGSSTSTPDAAPSPTSVVGRAPEPVVAVDDLVLTDYATDPAGAPFALRADPGGLLLVYFGYLSCPDVCPLTMADTATGLAELTPDEAARVQVGFVTVDPARDTGAAMVGYLGHFFPDGGTHALAATDDGALNKVTYRFGAKWQVDPHAPGDTSYGVAHTGDTYVVDDEGRLVWRWPFATTGADLAAAVRALLPPSDAPTGATTAAS